MRVTNAIDGSGGTTLTIAGTIFHPTCWNVASDNLYQDFQIVDVTADTPSIDHYSIFRRGHVAPGTTLGVIGYGCDQADESHNYQRQYAFFSTTEFGDSGYDDTWIHSPGPSPATCSGDSGGPVIVESFGQKEVAGLVSWGNGVNSWFSRTSAIYAWLQDPRVNLLQSGRKGHLLQKSSNKPIVLASQSSTAQVRIRNWDARNHWTGQDAQYWKLEYSQTSGFQIINTKTGKCLKAQSDGFVVQATCSSSLDMFWNFVNTTSNYSQIRNAQSNTKCMATSSDSVGSRVTVSTCSSTSARQRWVFSN
jgi:hypothetical protein